MINLSKTCVHCFNSYLESDSNADSKFLFCSKDCEVEEDARLVEGNRIYKEFYEQLNKSVRDPLESSNANKSGTDQSLTQGNLNQILINMKTKSEDIKD